LKFTEVAWQGVWHLFYADVIDIGVAPGVVTFFFKRGKLELPQDFAQTGRRALKQ
jgi:hypothetical protein